LRYPYMEELIKMKWLCLLFAIFLLLSLGVVGISEAQDYWNIGENRIDNGDFEMGNVGETPDGWELHKAG
jgi:hypothetical protein